MDLVFVVSTGRCGSTLLSRLLHGHPDVLSIDELFSFVPIKGRLTGRLDGGAFWAQVADPVPVIDAMLRDGLPLPELVYPYETGRFSPRTGVPLISHIILPMLSDDPDGVYDSLAAEVPHWPVRPVPDHYRRLFSWLAGSCGGSVVVERSGASIRFVSYLRRAFPEARFVYLSRDGVDCSLSMSKHAAFRLAILADVMVAGDQPGIEAEEQHAEDQQSSVPMFDRKSIMESPIPVSVFGSLWSAMTEKGAAELATMPTDVWTALRYEHLLRNPVAALRALAGFLGVTAPIGWLRWASRQVRPLRVGASAALDPADLAALRDACALGYDTDGMLYARQRVSGSLGG